MNQSQSNTTALYCKALGEALTATQKKYLLTIYHLRHLKVSQADVADQLCVTKASVHHVVHGLMDLGYVERYSRFHIGLSHKGQRVASALHRCYAAIVADLLRDIDPKEAAQQETEAWRLAIHMSPELATLFLHRLDNKKIKQAEPAQ